MQLFCLHSEVVHIWSLKLPFQKLLVMVLYIELVLRQIGFYEAGNEVPSGKNEPQIVGCMLRTFLLFQD